MSLVIEFRRENQRDPPHLSPSCGSLPLPPNDVDGKW